MKRTWRWFGPHDTVSIDDMLQAGVEAVVTALHHLPNGAVWTKDEIKLRQEMLNQGSGNQRPNLSWDVVESLPVSEDIKRQTGDWRSHIENYKQSIRNLADCGIFTICYNFMPVLDWTRTNLSHELPNGAKCMRFDLIDFVVFDIHILQREDADKDYPTDVIQAAETRAKTMTAADCTELQNNIICGLPGAEEGYSLADLRQNLDAYSKIDDETLRKHQYEFLREIVPLSEELGVKLCCHPDDPPFPLLGLPRVMSTEADFERLIRTVDSPANGITLCSGSLGVRGDNDLSGMMDRLGHRVHFIHLRNVARESENIVGSFHEAAHLEGATDMVALIASILAEEKRRKAEGRTDCNIPFRPDHGQDILSDLRVNGQPGYPAVGRLKGLAELRGIIAALSHPKVSQ
ncbi:D-mannonate dehydratase [Pacificibacter maritimus]|uniref:Mannonate dehydratase n=1 Tax=Pacificibacter maritimus TaxID=762213 RepID=A0A3N4UDR2_9RHOB|nr:mannonate dehydratase [Pacificibacter maritimus]RPE66575.1 D-mannonate dehydratase [Pacificibacter maritimus]